MWCVLEDFHTPEQFKYKIAAGFLGRLCWSGHIDKLSDEQFKYITDAEKFYEKVSHIIKNGRSRVYRTEDVINNRILKGSQAVVRYSDDKSEALVVSHYFNEPAKLCAELDAEYEIADSLYDTQCSIQGTVLTVCGDAATADVLYLKRK